MLEAETEADSDKPCILVADDSRVIRKAIMKILGPKFNIIETGDGEAAWRQVSQISRIDVLVTDIDMPKLDGYSLICRIRASADAGLRELPVIVITGAEDDITKERAYACGANDFILKPLKSDQMLGCVKAHLEGYDLDNVEAPKVAPVMGPHEIAAKRAGIKLSEVETAVQTVRAANRAGTVDSYALDLALRLIPLLDYCNKSFNLGLEKELLILKKRILTAR